MYTYNKDYSCCAAPCVGKYSQRSLINIFIFDYSSLCISEENQLESPSEYTQIPKAIWISEWCLSCLSSCSLSSQSIVRRLKNKKRSPPSTLIEREEKSVSLMRSLPREGVACDTEDASTLIQVQSANVIYSDKALSLSTVSNKS
ncbi:uncharacterized protein LOC117301675 [Asterias rubens]|uniref:uncharacterized protein LOC117301675 n=1 Tax=Asterias rubens TaxID=7604 RepID=UPI001455C256|nr:uncharacterized protein LOC117301675 [Asterias rubens]